MNGFMNRLIIGLTMGLLLISGKGWCEAYRPIKEWKYSPINAANYELIQSLPPNSTETVETLFDLIQKNQSSLAGAEAQAFLGKTCLALNWYFCAYHFSLDVISNYPGSMPSFISVGVLDELYKRVNFYEEELETAFSQGGFIEIPEAYQGMANFFVMQNNLRLNFKNWAADNFSTLKEPDFWFYKLQFLIAIDLVKKNQIEKARELLTTIAEKTKAFPEFNMRVTHQIARLAFELGDFEGAEAIYANLQTSSREYGRALIERAWIRYIKTDYAVALGMIHSLRAPSLSQSQHPDQYKLQMIILRELCYFKAIKKVAAEFREKYREALDTIESGNDLSENKELLNLVFQKAQWLPWATIITQIRAEQQILTDTFPRRSKILNYFRGIYNKTEFNLRAKAKALLKPHLENVARELLEIREQVNLLDYLVGLDQIRPKDIKQKVRAEQIENFAIDKLYWPQGREYWRSEMNNIKVLISDRCQGD